MIDRTFKTNTFFACENEDEDERYEDDDEWDDDYWDEDEEDEEGFDDQVCVQTASGTYCLP